MILSVSCHFVWILYIFLLFFFFLLLHNWLPSRTEYQINFHLNVHLWHYIEDWSQDWETWFHVCLYCVYSGNIYAYLRGMQGRWMWLERHVNAFCARLSFRRSFFFFFHPFVIRTKWNWGSCSFSFGILKAERKWWQRVGRIVDNVQGSIPLARSSNDTRSMRPWNSFNNDIGNHVCCLPVPK